MKTKPTEFDAVLDNPTRFPWGEMTDTYSIGEYAFIEYIDKHDGQKQFQIYINGEDAHRSASTLDEALVYAIAYKRDGMNSRAGEYFMKMTT